MERFTRIERLIGKDKFGCLKDARVCVVGIGAVGSYACEALGRSGVGNLTIVDFDTVNKTNINRQLHAMESTIGQIKIEVMKKRLLDINPACNVRDICEFAHIESFDEILKDKPDYVIDAIDSFTPKTELLIKCFRENISVVSSMGAALRRDPVKIQISDLMDTKVCPLAKRVRKKLKLNNIGRGITAVFSTEKIDFKYLEPHEEECIEYTYERGRPRRVLGSLPTIPGIFGLTVANEVILKITGHK